MHSLLTNPNLNGAVSLFFSLAAFVILLPIIFVQIRQFRVKRLLVLKGALLAITVIALLTTIPALFVQYQKFTTGDYDDTLSLLSSVCNAISRAVLASALAAIYFNNQRSN